MGERKAIVVLYKGANILSLPYKDKEEIKYFDFKPGNNKTTSDVWEAVQASNKKRMSHYSKYLKVIVPEVEKTVSDVDEVEEVINPSDYNVDEAVELIQGCMELTELEEMRAHEENGKDRVSVMSAIEAQKEEVTAFLKKIEDEKEG
jgi:hypothetical protein